MPKVTSSKTKVRNLISWIVVRIIPFYRAFLQGKGLMWTVSLQLELLLWLLER